MLYNTVEIAAIKLALQNMEHQEQKCKTVLLGSIRWLRETYERTRDEVFLKKAVWHIYAYLEMGFLYEYGKEEFTYVLNYLHKSADEMNPPWKNHYKKIRVSKVQICKLLGSWNPKLHCMKIGDAVNDIIEKINSGKVGEYTYHCGKQIQEERGEGNIPFGFMSERTKICFMMSGITYIMNWKLLRKAELPYLINRRM